MKIQLSQSAVDLPTDGVYPAIVKSTRNKNDSKCVIEFEITNGEKTWSVTKEYAVKQKADSPLIKDSATILKSPISVKEFDTDSLVGKSCQVVVARRKTSGNKLVATVTTVLAEEVPAKA